MSLLDTFRAVILANELENNPRLAYRFSDPDGVRSGKSGWSFGVCQFDISNNPSAIICLREMGFTTDEIAGLKNQSIKDMAPLNDKLVTGGSIIDRWDSRQLEECLTVPSSICRQSGIEYTDSGLIGMADYHNQYYMSRGGKLHTWLKKLNSPVLAGDVFHFKIYNTLYGQKCPKDCERRYNNIVKIMGA